MSTPAVGTRRELTTAVAGSAAAGALALMSSGQTWVDVTVTRAPPLPPFTDAVSGSSIAPLVQGTGLVLLAGALAVVAVQGVPRVVVGLLLAVGGGTLGATAIGVLGGRSRPGLGDVSAVGLSGARLESSVHAGWPALALVAGVLAVAVGVLVVLRGRRWSGMSRRYERSRAPAPAGPASGAGASGAAVAGAVTSRNRVSSTGRPPRELTAEDRHQLAWKALDRGEDPTA